jgi:predicted RNase H-like HicB family nuclease
LLDIFVQAVLYSKPRWAEFASFLGILISVLRYHVAYYLPKENDRMVVAEVLDFPGVVSQGFDLADARVMIASALEDVAQIHLEEGKPLPVPSAEASAPPDADLVELVPLSVEAGVPRP